MKPRRRPAAVLSVAVPAPAVREALRLAGGDRRRLSVVPAPGAVGGAAMIVRNRP